MGISTLLSYRGAQIFEAIGLGRDLIDRYFPGTPSRIERHRPGRSSPASRSPRTELGYPASPAARRRASWTVGGEIMWRRRGEHHMWNPETIQKLQHSLKKQELRHLQGVRPRRPTTRAGSSARSAGCSRSARAASRSR